MWSDPNCRPRGEARRCIFSIVVALTLVAAAAGCRSQGGDAEVAIRNSGARYADTLSSADLPPRGYAWVIFGADTVVAEVAETSAQREQGLMFREELADGTGMIFVFQNEAVRSFWMRNTYIPLDVAFLDSTMAVVDIQQMEPETEEFHTSSAPAMFGVEVPQGWFEAHGVQVGDQAEIVFGPR